jgi:hypothetical protein
MTETGVSPSSTRVEKTRVENLMATTRGAAMTWNAWEFADRQRVGTGESLIGFAVMAVDGPLGRVHSATTDVGTSHLVVDTEDVGSGELLVLPAGVVDSIDADGKQVYLGRTANEVLQAPTLNDGADDPKSHERLEGYCGGYYWTAPSDATSPQARESAVEDQAD